MSESRGDYSPPSEEAMQAARAELARLLGERCAGEVMRHTRSFVDIYARNPNGPAAYKVTEVKRVAALAAELVALLSDPEVETLVWARQGNGLRFVSETVGTVNTCRLIGEAAADAAAIFGRPRANDWRARFLEQLAAILRRHGHKASTAENSRMVRVARTVWPLLPFGSEDPRDPWRRLMRAKEREALADAAGGVPAGPWSIDAPGGETRH